MFKKTRLKIVASIMSILVLLFLGTLIIIYGSSYYEVSKSNHKMLERYAELYSLEEQPSGDDFPVSKPKPHLDMTESDFDKPVMDAPHFEDTPVFRLSTFYSVALSENGEILAIHNDNTAVHGNEELADIANEIVNGRKVHGIKENLIYIMVDKEDYTLVAFMDNTIMQKSMTTLFRYTLIFGCVAIILFFFLAVYLAKRIIQPLEESYHKQKQFISDAGHELKTPVSVVSTNAELLSREIGENQWLSNIQYENERMGALIMQLLELARTENVRPQMESIDFSHLVAGETLAFESVAFESKIILNSNIADDVYINGNSVQLKQLISILLDNAVRHCSNGKEVLLTLKCERNTAVLSVINDGKEIPKEQQRQIFERFYRVDSSRNSADKHYGLGLAIAKAIVIGHKGKIEVQCCDGKIKFIVNIPLYN